MNELDGYEPDRNYIGDIINGALFITLLTIYGCNNWESEKDVIVQPTPLSTIVNEYSGEVTYAITDTVIQVVPTPNPFLKPEDSMTEEGTIFFYQSITQSNDPHKELEMK